MQRKDVYQIPAWQFFLNNWSFCIPSNLMILNVNADRNVLFNILLNKCQKSPSINVWWFFDQSITEYSMVLFFFLSLKNLHTKSRLLSCYTIAKLKCYEKKRYILISLLIFLHINILKYRIILRLCSTYWFIIRRLKDIKNMYI